MAKRKTKVPDLIGPPGTSKSGLAAAMKRDRVKIQTLNLKDLMQVILPPDAEVVDIKNGMRKVMTGAELRRMRERAQAVLSAPYGSESARTRPPRPEARYDFRKDLKQGIWQTREGKRLKIVEMSDEHLRNAIAYLEQRPKWRKGYLPLMRQELANRIMAKNDPSLLKGRLSGQLFCSPDQADLLEIQEEEERERFQLREV